MRERKSETNKESEILKLKIHIFTRVTCDVALRF